MLVPSEPSEASSLEVESGTPVPLIPIDLSQFKDSIGRYRTVSLFLELNDDKKFPSYYTLKDRDYKGHTSLRRMYMEMMDLEEYAFAQKAFGSWDHWQKMINNYWFKPIINEWRKELQLKLSSEQFAHIRTLAKRNDAIGLSAARALLALTAPKTRGRPSKQEIENEKRKQVVDYGDTEADAARLGLVVVPFQAKDSTING